MAQPSVSFQSERSQLENGPVQGSQGLVQTLLELGETFLASGIGEEDLQDLEAKLSAARSRDCNTIRELQKKIEELSGMSAMVSRLKDELREEKEKAKEEAEDMTQEMAELRYQLMERVEQERELRAHTEQASLRRISELEEQLKHARQATMAALGRKQSAEAHAEARALELRHLKSAFEVMKQTHASLTSQKEEVELKLMSQLQELQAKVTNLETDLSKASLQLKTAEEKVAELEDASQAVKKESEEMLLTLEQQKKEAFLQLKIAEEKVARLEDVSHTPKKEMEEKLLTLQQQKLSLQLGVTEMQQLLADFKLELQLLAEEYQRSEDKLQGKTEFHGLSIEENEMENHMKDDSLPSYVLQELPAEDKRPVCTDEGKYCRDFDPVAGLKEEVKELQIELSSLHGEGEHQHIEEKHSSFCTEGEVAEKSLQMDSASIEELLKENECLQYELKAFQLLQNKLQLQLKTMSIERDIALQKLQQQSDAFSTSGPSLIACDNTSADSPDKKQERPWSVQEIVEIVESVTEELTKLLRLVLKCPLSRKQDFLSSLELRLQSWSNVPQKTLPDKVARNGAIAEWGDLVVDLVGQSRRELQAMQHRLRDFESEVEMTEAIRTERNTLSKEATCLKEELARAESRYVGEIARREEEVHALERKLEQTHLGLLATQKRVTEQEETMCSLRGQIRKLELEAERSKSTWASEKRQLEESLRERHKNLQIEKGRAAKEVEELEKRVQELLHRLEENDQELGELMEISGIDIDAVVAAKLRRLDQNLKDSHTVEAQLQAERAELASQVVWLQAKLEEAEHELQAENEEHVEVLIRYEEERGLMEAELEAAKHNLSLHQAEMEHASSGKATFPSVDKTEIARVIQELIDEQNKTHGFRKLGEVLYSKEAELLLERKCRFEAEKKQRELCSSLEGTLFQLSAIEIEFESAKRRIEQLEKSLHSSESKLLRFAEEEKTMKDSIQKLKEKAREQDQLLVCQEEELFVQKEIDKNSTNHAAALESEVLTVHQQLLLCESQANEMGLTIVNLQEALMLERMKTSQAQEDTNLQAKRLARQEEDYLHLKMKFNALLTNLDSSQANLRETRRREGEAQAQVKKLGLELSLAKEEVVKSEVRLQKTLKQTKEQLDAERRKLEAAINAQKHSEWFLERQTEHLQNLEAEKLELERLLGQLRGTCDQVEKERDDLKTAYAELENQFAKRRVAFTK